MTYRRANVRAMKWISYRTKDENKKEAPDVHPAL
jgi:hypothetical protein